MSVYGIDKSGRIIPFDNREDAEEWFESRGDLYELVDHWPSPSEYFKANEVLSSSATIISEKIHSGDVICDQAYCRLECRSCPHRKPHKPIDGLCDGTVAVECHVICADVKCIQCEGEV